MDDGVPVAVAGLTVQNQIFALANQTASIFESAPADGLMGMGFSTIAESRAPTFMENLIANKAVAANLFSFYLQRSADLTTASSGTVGGGGLCIGCIDSSKFTGSVTYTPVVVQGYWEVAMQGLYVNGTLMAGTSTRAAIDTGTSLVCKLFLPSLTFSLLTSEKDVPVAVAQAFYQPLGGIQVDANKGYWALPCRTPAFTLEFAFGGQRYAMDLEDLLYGYADSSRQYCVLSILAQDVGPFLLSAVIDTENGCRTKTRTETRWPSSVTLS